MYWLKVHLLGIILMFMVVAYVFGMTFLLGFYMTHNCVDWDACGLRCNEWESIESKQKCSTEVVKGRE